MDQAIIDAPFNYDPKPDLKKLRVGYRSSFVSAAVRNRLAAIVGETQLVSISLPNYPAQGMVLVIMGAEGAAAFDELTRFGGDAFLTSQGTYDWPNTFRVARTIPAVEYLQTDRLRQKLVQEMGRLMQTIDVYVTTDTDELSLAITNLTGQPCAVIPNGGSTSLSFIGKPFDEATLLALAKAYQDGTSFHTNRPPLFVN